jgi:hypothetical protein
MVRRRPPATRPLVVALLVLAVSPVTAPFSTCDLQDLFGEQPAHRQGFVEPKTSGEGPAVPAGGPALDPALRPANGITSRPPGYGIRAGRVGHTVLRI